MKERIGFVLLVCAVAAAVAVGGANEPSRANPQQGMTIVLFGDSTTAPRGDLAIFGTLLQEHLPGAAVVNAGVGGNSTADARLRFEQDVLAREPDVVTVAFGINDAAIDVWKGDTEPRVPIEIYRVNLRHFVETLKERGSRPILMTPNPLAWTPKLIELYGKPPYDPDDSEGFNVLLADYAEVVRNVAVEEEVPLVDVWQLFKEHQGNYPDESLLLDGMHPNARGHRLVADALLKVLPSVLAES
ncbi:MAG: SGNH/GDSL hydrolase family protein [Candidatus Hydrogenedentes bacterium]|nr:SGNH/GDSL hydrolase family protein [Candidatus Hydrogenedentota bacterium]